MLFGIVFKLMSGYNKMLEREKVLFRRALGAYYEESLFEVTAIDLLEKLKNSRNI
ncbi:unnamed protein product [marine sediment metagenome]|uniref:Uncharacterized protein n=1 Tax=marine sediment metagenome TaxID=412755 RepID=X0Z2C6_9ZZZZ